LYRQDTRRVRVATTSEAETFLTIGEDRVGYAKVTRKRHDRKPTGKLAHLWWYRCLERAGLVAREREAGCICTEARIRRRRSCSVLTTTYA
jgi:hypothetical protein